ncbi:MAG: glutamate racemase, partial [Proteobacteria bacterium]|nr:glutamate racemase [Pseudomonadota bacterium]
LPAGVTLVDSAATTARAVAQLLAQRGLASPLAVGATHFLATDGAERFARVGSIFLGRPLLAAEVELVDV